MDFRKWAECVNPSQHLLFDSVSTVMRDSTELHKNNLSICDVWESCREDSEDNFDFQIWSLNSSTGGLYFAYGVVFPHLKYVPILIYKECGTGLRVLWLSKILYHFNYLLRSSVLMDSSKLHLFVLISRALQSLSPHQPSLVPIAPLLWCLPSLQSPPLWFFIAFQCPFIAVGLWHNRPQQSASFSLFPNLSSPKLVLAFPSDFRSPWNCWDVPITADVSSLLQGHSVLPTCRDVFIGCHQIKFIAIGK